MAWIPNRIVLKSRGRYDEAQANADIYPGMFGLLDANGKIGPQTVVGAGGPLLIVLEDALQGKTIETKIASADQCPFQRPANGDEMLCLLQNGQNVAAQVALMNAGDGTLMVAPAALMVTLHEILAASTAVTNTTVETTFSNGTYTIPADYLKAGMNLRLRGRVVVSAENSTNTHRIKVKIGSTVLADSGAIALAAGEYVQWDLEVTIRTAGSSGTLVASGTLTHNATATVVTIPISVASTTVNTTTTQAVTVTTTASAASTGNVDALQELEINATISGTPAVVAISDEAIDNSGGTGTSDFGSAAFIRCTIPG